MVTLRTTLLLVLLFAVSQLSAQTTISGLTSGTWEADGNPYIIEGDVFVGPDERLSVKEGVEILFSGEYRFEIYGRFDAVGTSDEPILFTLEDTTGFAAGTAGWRGISFPGGGSSSEYSYLNNCIVEYSTGNGLTCSEFSLLQINNSVFRNHKGFGLGIYQFSNILVDGIDINNNELGGIDIEFSTPQVSNFLIENNKGSGIRLFGDLTGGDPTSFSYGEIQFNETSFNGGGISLTYNYTVEMLDVSISQNDANLGGGIYTTDGYISLDQVTIQSNSAQYGGGLYVDYGTDIIIDHAVVVDNYAEFEGGAMYVVESTLDMAFSTISNNEAGGTAGALYYQVEFAPVANITSSIIWGNYPEEIYVTSNKPLVTYSNVAVSYYGIGNINEDPLFVNAESGNYQLGWDEYPAFNTSKSPCIDAGDPELTYDPDGTIADMGAYYFYQSTITNITKSQDAHFSIYPNPASHSIKLERSQEIEKLYIMNMSGHIVKEVSSSQINSDIELSGLASGIYFVNVVWENGSISTKKLIKE